MKNETDKSKWGVSPVDLKSLQDEIDLQRIEKLNKKSIEWMPKSKKINYQDLINEMMKKLEIEEPEKYTALKKHAGIIAEAIFGKDKEIK